MNASNILQPTINTGPTNLQPTASQSFGNFMGWNNDVQFDNNLDLMDRANQFNQFMSDTQYQRTFADMEKAGINPIIAFGLGKGQLDSAPTSATASTASNSGKGLELIDTIIKSITSTINAVIGNAKDLLKP